MVNDKIKIRDRVYLSVSFEHRLTDGREVALFTRELIKALENPYILILELTKIKTLL